MSSKDGQRTNQDQALVAAGERAPGIPRLRVVDLLGDAREAIIEHEGQDYRLRITSNRKLILTK